MSYSTEVTEAASQWMVRHRATEDPAVVAKIIERAQENLERLGGFISPSSFERAYLELTSEGVIKPFRGSLLEKPAAAPAIPPDVVTFIESPRTSASELRHRYRTDPPFRKQYDLHEKTKGQAQVQQSASLTVEEYRRLPAAIVVQKYRQNGAFRAQVDALIAKGLIALVLGLLLHGGVI